MEHAIAYLKANPDIAKLSGRKIEVMPATFLHGNPLSNRTWNRAKKRIQQ